jgi:hypothetical protein
MPRRGYGSRDPSWLVRKIFVRRPERPSGRLHRAPVTGLKVLCCPWEPLLYFGLIEMHGAGGTADGKLAYLYLCVRNRRARRCDRVSPETTVNLIANGMADPAAQP